MNVFVKLLHDIGIMKLFKNLPSILNTYKHCNSNVVSKSYEYLHSKKFSSSAKNLTQNVDIHTVIINHVKRSSTRVSKLPEGPDLKEFIRGEPINTDNQPLEAIPYVQNASSFGQRRKVYFDIYGCQMNVNDTEIIWSILKSNGFLKTDNLREADVVLVITCAIRDGAESKVWNRLEYLKGIRNSRNKKKNTVQMKIGLLGCMAERLKHKVLEKDQAVDLGMSY